METFLGILIVVGAIWYFRRKKKRSAALSDAGQRWVEDRIIDILSKDAHLTDDMVALMIRDEIVNAQVRDPEVFAWAIPETVARMRRNAIRLVLEEERPKPKKRRSKLPAKGDDA